jgi:hypothetical protein
VKIDVAGKLIVKELLGNCPSPYTIERNIRNQLRVYELPAIITAIAGLSQLTAQRLERLTRSVHLCLNIALSLGYQSTANDTERQGKLCQHRQVSHSAGQDDIELFPVYLPAGYLLATLGFLVLIRE